LFVPVLRQALPERKEKMSGGRPCPASVACLIVPAGSSKGTNRS
jgi:hypothetical protein